MSQSSIRPAQKSDASFIFQMIKELASFEKAPQAVELTEAELIRDGFGSKPLYECHILEWDNKAVGFFLTYYRYSTWKGKSLYLEDLYILPEFRGHGLGNLAMKFLAKMALQESCRRFEWQVLDWNEPAIKFYKKMGTELDSEWINCRLEGQQISDYIAQ